MTKLKIEPITTSLFMNVYNFTKKSWRNIFFRVNKMAVLFRMTNRKETKIANKIIRTDFKIIENVCFGGN